MFKDVRVNALRRLAFGMMGITGMLIWFVAAVCSGYILFCWLRTMSWQNRLFFAVFVLVAGLVLFRPHEDIFGGDDHGAYLNTAAAFERDNCFFREEPLLKDVPPEVRSDFLYYGHGSDVKTLFHAFRFSGDDCAEMRPWFQVGYPLLMSVAARIGGKMLILFVTPFFALLAGFALAGLAGLLFEQRWVGLAAFLLYTLNPLIVWHARYARAEIPATFFVFAGLYFFLKSLTAEERASRCEPILGAVCLGIAIFLHATAWLVLIPVTLSALWLAFRGLKRFIIFPLLGWCFAWLFVWQMAYLVHWYGLENVCRCFLSHSISLNIMAATIFIATLFAGDRNGTPNTVTHDNEIKNRMGRITGLCLGLVTLACFFSVSLLDSDDSFALSLLRMADLRGFAILTSPILVTLGLIGWLALFVMDDTEHIKRQCWLAVLLLPGLLFGYVMKDYMYGARYFLLYQVTALTLGFSGLCVLISRLLPRRRALAGMTVCVLLLTAQTLIHVELYTLTQFKGAFRFFEKIAERVKRDDGRLLVEYSRFGTPLRHLFGVPALGLDNEYTFDYRAAEKSWLKIIEADPDRPAYFLTPFDGLPLSRRICFDKVWGGDYKGRRLATRTYGYPSCVKDWEITLNMYRMTPRVGTSVDTQMSRGVLKLPLSESNMGFVNFSACVNKGKVNVNGFPVHRNDFATVLWENMNPSPLENAGLFMLFLAESGTDELELMPKPKQVVHLRTADGVTDLTLSALGGGWFVARADAADIGEDGGIELKAEAHLLMTDAFLVRGTRVTRLNPAVDDVMEKRKVPPFKARWARNGARLTVPALKNSFLMIFAVPPVEVDGTVNVRIGRDSGPVENYKINPGEWGWIITPLWNSHSSNGVVEVRLETDRVLDLRPMNLPADISLLTGRCVILTD